MRTYLSGERTKSGCKLCISFDGKKVNTALLAKKRQLIETMTVCVELLLPLPPLF